MSEIQSFSDYQSKYSVNTDLSALFSGLNTSSSSSSNGLFNVDLAEYGLIKKGSYRKLVKAYYAQNDSTKNSSSSSTSSASSKQLTLMKSSADALQKSADALKSSALWEKKTITTKNEETGEQETKQDYDWDAITKSVSAFVKDYNDMIDEAGESSDRNVLQQAVWMTNMTAKSESLLDDIGISVGKDNKLTLDEDALKQSDISTLKTLFTGQNSFASKVSARASAMSQSTLNTSGTYTSSGVYNRSDTLSKLVAGKVDEEV
jgi:hypothetical protein